MAKAKVNFYWKGKYIEAGTEAPDGVPEKLVEKIEKPKRKARKPKSENKNAAPKAEDK